MPRAVEELEREHEALMKRRSEAVGKLKAVDEDLGAVRRVLGMLEPGHPLVRPKVGRPPSQEKDVQVTFKVGECPDMVLSVLRDADTPVDVRMLTAAILDAKGIDPTGLRVKTLSRRISHVLEKLEFRNRVKRTESDGRLHFSINR